MIDIKNKQDCCGCSACAQRCPKQCISMQMDNEGFLYPQVDISKCIDCHLCEKVCPVINQYEARTPLNVYAAKNSDDEVRHQSSSGGIFTLLAEQTIKDGGVVFGACWDKEWNVKHDCVDNISDLYRFRSSKYLQSVIGDSYLKAEHFLKTGRKVMFTGTPCQIAGIKHFLRKEYDNLLTVEVICHSVPSPGVWQQYLTTRLHTLKWNKSDIRNISFRDKKTGWKTYSFVIENENGNILTELSSKNAFMRGFLADLYTRPSCHACPAKQLRSGSDITLGDFWGIESLMPEIDDDKGVSAIIVNTDKGKQVLHNINVELHEVQYNELTTRNPALVKSFHKTPKRTEFFKEDGFTFEEKVKRLAKKPFSMKTLAYRIVRKIIPNMVVEKLKRLLR